MLEDFNSLPFSKLFGSRPIKIASCKASVNVLSGFVSISARLHWPAFQDSLLTAQIANSKQIVPTGHVLDQSIQFL